MNLSQSNLSGAALRVGLLCNPTSGRNRKRLDAVRRAAAGFPESMYLEASTSSAMNMALDSFANNRIDLVAIIGGDGTVHAVLNHLFKARPFPSFPLLTIIPAGTTNMTASDLDMRGNPERALVLLRQRLQFPVSSGLLQRPVLRLEHKGAAACYGMFFGAGMIADGVRLFTPDVQKLAITSELASGIIILRHLLKRFLGNSRDSLTPVQASVRENGNTAQQGLYSVVIASALERLLLGARPYWGSEASPIHVTLIRHPPRRFWRSLPALLSGRGAGLNEACGYHSRNLQSLELVMNSEFIIDGEVYQAQSQQGPLQITAEGPVTFVPF
ncbi:MAG: diacylglycerol/lipid kinase family protein [Gammaproteobacteria bacterium]